MAHDEIANGTVDSRLQILLVDYQATREDERTLRSVQAVLFGVAVTLVAGIASLLTRTQADDIPDLLLVGVPLVPLALIAFFMLFGLASTVRYYYLRALEAELRSYSPQQLTELPRVPPASGIDLLSELVSFRRGLSGYPMLGLVIVFSALVVFGGFAMYLALEVEPVARGVMAMIYIPAILFLLVQAARGSIGGRGLFMRVAQAYADRSLREDKSIPQPRSGAKRAAAPRERSLVSYLLLPRLEEIPKAFILPGVFLVAGAALGGYGDPMLIRAFVVWIALEYLIYEARYQWNDARGLHEDFEHVDRESRARLPVGDDPPRSTRVNLRASAAVASLRLILAPLLALVVGYDTLVPVMILMAATFAFAVPYELLRSTIDNQGIARRRRELLSRAVWLLVGGGYMVRAAGGLYLAGFALDSGVMIVGAAAFFIYGIMFVALTWALESLTLSLRTSHGTLVDKDNRCHKLHVRMLRKYLDEIPEPPYRDCTKCGKRVCCEHDRPEEDFDLKHARALRKTGDYMAPWNLALFGCAALGGALGSALASSGDFNSWLLLAAGSLGAALALASTTGRNRLVVAVVGTLFLTALGYETDAAKPLLAAMPWLAFSGLYVYFRESSYHSLKIRWGELRMQIEQAGVYLLTVLVGSRTMASLQED